MRKRVGYEQRWISNRQRPIQVKFFVNKQELEQIKERMAMFGTDNLSAHLVLWPCVLGDRKDDSFAVVSKVSGDEQEQLKAKVKNPQREINVQEQQIGNLEQFINRATIPNCRNARHILPESLCGRFILKHPKTETEGTYRVQARWLHSHE